VEEHCPGAVVGVDEPGLIVIAPDREQARAAAAEVRDFRRELDARYRDLLGRPRFDRMVIAIFPDAAAVQAFAGGDLRADRDMAAKLHGYTDPVRGAVFLPADALSVLRHEAVHWIMEAARNPTAPPYSPWLAEGMAQLFETFEPLASPPAPPHVGRLPLPAPGIDVDRLLGLEDYGEFVGEDGPRNYLESLALAAFLFETRREGLRAYIAVEQGQAGNRSYAFRRIFRHDEAPFREELAAFVARIRG
jgi:hypothetical protein